MKYNQFVENWEKSLSVSKPSHIREGQWLMIYLGDVWLEEYERIQSLYYYDETNIDCFYNDSLIPNTLKHLEKVWVNFPN